jgi:hypothetical protein
MPMLAEVVDAVVGGDTHRDTHALELTAPSGATIATVYAAPWKGVARIGPKTLRSRPLSGPCLSADALDAEAGV